MHNNQEFATALRLNNFNEVHVREPDVTESLILTIPNTIFYHRGVKARDLPMDITVENDDGLICFCGPGKVIAMVFTIEELRAIMRLFDVPQNE